MPVTPIEPFRGIIYFHYDQDDSFTHFGLGEHDIVEDRSSERKSRSVDRACVQKFGIIL